MVRVGNVIADITLTYDNNADSSKATKTYEGPEVGAYVHATTTTAGVAYEWGYDPEVKPVKSRGATYQITADDLGKVIYVKAWEAGYASVYAATPEVVPSSRTIAKATLQKATKWETRTIGTAPNQKQVEVPIEFEDADTIQVGDTLYVALEDSEENPILPMYGVEYQWMLDETNLPDSVYPGLNVKGDYVNGTVSVEVTPDDVNYTGDAVTVKAGTKVAWNAEAKAAILDAFAKNEAMHFNKTDATGFVYAFVPATEDQEALGDAIKYGWDISGLGDYPTPVVTSNNKDRNLEATISKKTGGTEGHEFEYLALTTNLPVQTGDTFKITLDGKTFTYTVAPMGEHDVDFDLVKM
jgi:hypothetical protein